MKILVTGGAGYLGSILVPTLLGEGHQVTVLDNLMYRQSSLLGSCSNPQLEFVRGDCRDERIVHDLVQDKDCIIPLAALVGAPLCAQDSMGAWSVNFEAVHRLGKLVSASQRIIFPVTNSGYGVGEPGKYCTEDTPLRPISLYGEGYMGQTIMDYFQDGQAWGVSIDYSREPVPLGTGGALRRCLPLLGEVLYWFSTGIPIAG